MSLIRHILDHTLNSPQRQHWQSSSFAQFRKSAGPVPQNIRARAVFFTSLFSMLGKLARADGHLDQFEIDALEKSIQTTLHLDASERRIGLDIFKEAKTSARSFEDFAKDFYDFFSKEKPVLNVAIEILFAVSLADGVLQESEDRLLAAALGIFHLDSRRLDSVRIRYAAKADVNDPYQILGCSNKDSIETIKKAHRRLVKQNHPDNLQNLGLSAEFRTFASKRFLEIQGAYEKILSARGE